jgi:hypothetical protein
VQLITFVTDICYRSHGFFQSDYNRKNILNRLGNWKNSGGKHAKTS